MLSILNLDTMILIHEDKWPYLGIITSQMSLKQGLKMFGEQGERSVLKKMKQLHNMETFFPHDPKTLTQEQSIIALSLLIFLKKKCNGEVKSCTCLNKAPLMHIPKIKMLLQP